MIDMCAAREMCMNATHNLVVHITTDEIQGWQTALRNLQNVVQDRSVSTPPDRIAVVVNGPAVRFLLTSSPESPNLTKMVEAGVTLNVCENSLARFDHDPNDLTEGVTVVPSGVAAVVSAQQDGSTYLKLP